MSARGRFLDLADAGSDASIERLVAVARQDHTDMGAVRAVFRAWPGTVFWVVAAVVVLAVPWAALISPDPDARPWLAALLAGLAAFWLAVFAAAGVIERHRVCEHGMVVGFRTRSRYVIPWSSVDPGRVRIVRRSNFVGRLPGMPPSSPHYRVGMVSGTAVALNGLDSAIEGWVRIPGMLEVSDARTPGGRGRRTPFVWWLLGTRRPERLVRAIEEAMVADGYPADGLAARATRQAVTLRYNPGTDNPLPPRQTTDPVIGVGGADLP